MYYVRMVPRPSSASWNMAEGALDETIALLTQGEASARTRALLVEARRLRSRIASWRAIPPPPATRKEAFESAMHLLRKAGAEVPPSPPAGAPSSSAPPPRSVPQSGVSQVARPVSSTPPAAPPSSAAPASPRKQIIAPGVVVVRPKSMDWRPFHFLEGVDMKVLHREEGGMFRALVRLAPGGEIPRHRHMLPEDIVILEGTLEIDGVIMRAGEFCHAEVGSVHDVSRTPAGCTFLLVGSEKNEILW